LKDLATERENYIEVDVFCKESLGVFAEEIKSWNFKFA